jgi:hypothetical protein
VQNHSLFDIIKLRKTIIKNGNGAGYGYRRGVRHDAGFHDHIPVLTLRAGTAGYSIFTNHSFHLDNRLHRTIFGIVHEKEIPHVVYHAWRLPANDHDQFRC